MYEALIAMTVTFFPVTDFDGITSWYRKHTNGNAYFCSVRGRRLHTLRSGPRRENCSCGDALRVYDPLDEGETEESK
jgi:hypothetical protein